MQSTCSILFVMFLGILAFQCCARDTITPTTLLTSDSDETLVSAGKAFELGFLQLQFGDSKLFLCIWYYNLNPKTIVWIANRDLPLLQGPGYLAISTDGNAKLLDSEGASYFNTDLPSSTPNTSRTLKLLDSGNLALFDNGSEPVKFLWQSFTQPTDTFLPGMVMDQSTKLVSWMDPGNPATGNYSFQEFDEKGKLLLKVMKKNVTYWRSDYSNSELPSYLSCFLSNCTETTIKYNETAINNQSRIIWRLFMNSSGEIQFHSLDSHTWSVIWSEPHDDCSVFRPCGESSLCSNIQGGGSTCNCLPGFVPIVPEDFSKGCRRSVPTCDGKSKQDQFLSLKMINLVKVNTQITPASSDSMCRQACLDDCKSPCEAYYFKVEEIQRRRGDYTISNGSCWIWTSELKNLQEYDASGHDLYIRLPDSAIESSSRICKPCGKYVIPYPLSTGTECGDPSYRSFSCNDSTGQLDFLAMNNSYQVIRMYTEKQKFEVQTFHTDGCSSTSGLQFNESLPFDVTICNTLSDSQNRYEIAWRPPLEPICNSTYDCQTWPESSCYAKQDKIKRCFCNSDFRWDGKALKCISSGPLTAARKATTKPSTRVIIAATVAGAILLAGSIGCLLYRRRKGGSLERDDEDLVDEDGNMVDLAYFSMESVLEATQKFSDSNKLGQGGFGPVYKGVFPGSQEIAVKRLLSQTGQGMDEFRNEVVTIAKLQHRNLVRLLGYCIKGPERLLLYEYMPNTSLDNIIFDQERCVLLDYSMRFDIILGIARGLLYLHQDSRLRIIHRDLKTSNILLDEHMNPKISDFGLARIFAGKEIEANTMRVVGTYGYMSPEYAQAGFYSVKSDVFSFGVIVLEIISGKKNTGFYNSGEVLSLLGYAWRLWEEGNAINLVDERILKSSNDVNNVIKCINIGLLCVQDDPSDRPTMSNVLHMLGTEVTTTLPTPKEPGFVPGKFTFGSMSTSTSSLQAETRSVNNMSVTLLGGR